MQTYNSRHTYSLDESLYHQRSNFHMVIYLSIAVHAFPMHMLTLLSVDEILELRYMNWCTNFSSLPFNKELAPFWLKHILTKPGSHRITFIIILEFIKYQNKKNQLINNWDPIAIINLADFSLSHFSILDRIFQYIAL